MSHCRRNLVIVGLIALTVLGFLVFPALGTKAELKYNSAKTMVLVPGARVAIGGDQGGDSDETSSYQLDLAAYWIDVKEVANRDFAQFASSRGLAFPPDSADLPAAGVSWFEAVEYCNWLSQKEGLNPAYTTNGQTVQVDWQATGYRLPSEAEWENAARGGPYSRHSRYPGSGDVQEVAHFWMNATETSPRGILKPNELGLYDMAGNVWEWVWDQYGMFPTGLHQDYRGADSDFRVIRGGAWNNAESEMRVGNRNFLEPGKRDQSVGFRLARTASGSDAQRGGTVNTPVAPAAPPNDAAYKNAALPIEQRVSDLLSRMTLEEKIGQMTQIAYPYLGDPSAVTRYALGSLLTGGDSTPGEGKPEDWAQLVRGYQRLAVNSRLGIPLLFGIDSVHGAAKVHGATVFPHNIGLGAANDPSLVEAMGAAVAQEMRASGLIWNFAPCLAVVQDERWGRSYESFGSDPAIVSRLGAAYIRGLQGKVVGPGSVIATAKHFLADGGTQGGIDRGDAVMPESQLRRIHLTPYLAAVKEGVASVMASFSSWNGLSMHANHYLLVDVLRQELGFQGIVVSDWAAQKLLPGNPQEQVKTMINAGVDMCIVPDELGRGGFPELLSQAVQDDQVSLKRIDEAVGRILTLKFKLGLFEHPYGQTEQKTVVGSTDHRNLARQLVAKSAVVLKNDGVLPIRASTIWIGGALANDTRAQCGGWTMGWQGAQKAVVGATSLESAIRLRARAADIQVISSTTDGLPQGDKPELAIVVAGERPYAEFSGDRQDLRLSASDQSLVAALHDRGIPVVLVLVSGRPMIVTEMLPDLAGLVAVWLPGSEGAGVADVLFGDVPASGRLSVAWPRSNDQLPIGPGDRPLFPFGFGLDL